MSKYGPFTISARERSRLAWRQRVAHLDPSDPYRTRFVKFTRNPHGRSDR